MKTKTIEFDYNGGSYVQPIAIRGANMPWASECADSWVRVKDAPTAITVSVDPTYDYVQREGDVLVRDKFGNTLCLHVVQHGYDEVYIECPETVVMYDTYYDTNETYDIYITVYGGNRQEVSCSRLQPYLDKVWDNSEMYNDFKLRIPADLDGTFVIEHMEARRYRKYCKEHNIPYDGSAIRKTLKIVKISREDAIGKMNVEYDGKVYRNGDKITIEIDSLHEKSTKLLSSEFKRVLSSSSYEVVNNREVDFWPVPNWVSFTNKDGVVKISASEANRLADRVCHTRIVNTKNPGQFVDVDIIQKSIIH